jgi:hypothetical protein
VNNNKFRSYGRAAETDYQGEEDIEERYSEKSNQQEYAGEEELISSEEQRRQY